MSRTIAPTSELYLIEIPHQTTTQRLRTRSLLGCILSKFYIKPQLFEGFIKEDSVVSYRNSTSNHNFMECNQKAAELYLIEILHQTTTVYLSIFPLQGCILSKFYIKPQHLRILIGLVDVVSYRNSTSNHNLYGVRYAVPYVVSYRNSTSNHNGTKMANSALELYLIEILHQTTTNFSPLSKSDEWYLIEILHQTTTGSEPRLHFHGLYLIEILHQTTTCIPEGVKQ